MELSGPLLRRLEWSYGCSLAGVRIHYDRRSDQLNRQFGSTACAWGDHVALSSHALTSGPHLAQLILAHELAHVAQKRHASQENGGRAPSSLTTVAGHYTTLLVSRAAGFPPPRAERLAFFCQMPDQVNEFDATAIALKLLKKCFFTVAAQEARDVLRPSRPTGFSSAMYAGAATPGTVILVAAWEMKNAITAPLLDAVYAFATPADRARISEGARQAAAAQPNIDFPLGALTYAARMPPEATTAIFAIARTAGWIAHAAEEYAEPPLRFRGQAFRSRATLGRG